MFKLNKTLDPIYILGSSETLLITRARHAICNATLKEEQRAFNEDYVDGKTTKAKEILSLAQTLPMMADKRIIIVRNMSSMAASELTLLIPYIENPNTSTVLIGECHKIDKRLKFFSKAGRLGFICELNVPRDLSSWIKQESKRYNMSIDTQAVSRLRDIIGKDLGRLSTSLEQLALYAGDKSVSVDDVDDLIASTRERTVFELTDAIGAKNITLALNVLDKILQHKQSAIGTVALLARYVRQLRLAQSVENEHHTNATLAKLLGVPPFAVSSLMHQATQFQPRVLQQSLTDLLEADLAFKGQNDANNVLGKQLGETVTLTKLVVALAQSPN